MKADIPVPRRRQHSTDRLIIWVGIVDEIIIAPFNVRPKYKVER